MKNKAVKRTNWQKQFIETNKKLTEAENKINLLSSEKEMLKNAFDYWKMQYEETADLNTSLNDQLLEAKKEFDILNSENETLENDVENILEVIKYYEKQVSELCILVAAKISELPSVVINPIAGKVKLRKMKQHEELTKDANELAESLKNSTERIEKVVSKNSDWQRINCIFEKTYTLPNTEEK